MIFNAQTSLYVFNRLFFDAGVYPYVIECDGPGHYPYLNSSDYVSISEEGEPTGAKISVGETGRADSQITAGSTSTQGGNVTSVNLNTVASTGSWQGYYGSAIGNLTLGLNLSIFYDFGGMPPGEVYASRAQSVNFATLDCSVDMASENLFIGKSVLSGDSVTSVFDSSLHPEFYVAGRKFDADTCSATNLFVNNASQNSEFFEVIMEDAATNIVYTSLVNGTKTGFDGNLYDYEMIVGTPYGSTTTYYFFMEI
jgi:hypothetical protein